MKEFYDLFEYEALQSGAFGSLPVSKLFDRGLETSVQLRMLGAVKHDSGVSLRLLSQQHHQDQHQLHQTLLCWWRCEDKAEFERHLRLNERGEGMLRPRPPLAIAQLSRRGEGRGRTSAAVHHCGEECVDVYSLVDTDQFDAVEEGGDNGSLRLNRTAPGYCRQCKREHERDNARIYVRNSCAYYHCFRAAQGTPSVLLG